jgi:hypothetical protein
VLAKEATVAYNLGRYDEAATQYEAAYRLVQAPALLYNIAQAHRLAGKLDQALAAYKGFLRTAPDEATERASVEERVAELTRTLNNQRKAAEAAARSSPPATATAVAGPASEPVHAAAPGKSDARTATNPWLETKAKSSGRFATTAGGRLGWGGRGGVDESAANYGIFGRLWDRRGHTYELGYRRVPLYPMNPLSQYAALYGIFHMRERGWRVEAGALGGDGGWHLGAGYLRDYYSVQARFERVIAPGLCGSPQGAVLYLVPELGIHVPVNPRLRVVGLAAYRGKASVRDCDFRPSLLTLDLKADYTLTNTWRVSAGGGHYGLFDYGSRDKNPIELWPTRPGAAEHFHIGARHAVGGVALYAHYRYITYAGGSHELGMGIEFRSSPEAP